jgi:hypothetical protein
MSSPVAIFIDWGDDFTYAGSGSNVTEQFYFEAGMTFSRGKDQIRAFAPPAVGDCRLALRNDSRDYSPGNTDSPLYGQVKPGKRIRIVCEGREGEDLLFEEGDTFLFEEADTFEDEDTADRTLWTGIIDDFIQNPAFGIRAVEVPSFGMLSRLRGKTITTGLYSGILTSDALTVLLDAAGWPALDRVLMTGNNTLDWFWGDNEDAASVAIRILNSEGLGASLYEDADGNIVFENSTSRETQSRSVVPQASYEVSETSSNFTDLKYYPNFKSVVRQARITQREREAQPLSVIWTYGGDLVLTAGQVKKLIVRGSDPFLGAQIPIPFGTNEVQTLSPIVTLTSGTFTLTWKGQTTGAIAYNANAGDIQSELESLSNIGAGNVACGGGPINTTAVSIMFIGTLAEAEQELIAVTSQLNSSSLPTTLDIVRTDDGAGTYTDTLIPRNSPLTAGSFKLKQSSTTTPLILYTASATNIQTAWENTSQYDPGDVSASGGPIETDPVVINYTDGLTFPPSTTIIVDSTLTATRYKNALQIVRSVKGSGPDYVVVSGSVTMAIDRDNGGSLTLTITDGGSGSTITGLQLRAQPVSVVRTNEVAYPEDPASTEGKIETLDVVAEMPLATAQASVEAFYNRYSEERPTLVVLSEDSIFSAEAEGHFHRDVSDRVTVIEPHTGINEDYFIEYVRFSLSEYKLVTEFGCEKAM